WTALSSWPLRNRFTARAVSWSSASISRPRCVRFWHIRSARGLGRRDLLIAISFGRCLRATVEAMHQAHRQGVATFGITNSDVTPIARFSDAYVVASTASSTFSDSYAAPMSVLNAIVRACTHLQPRRTVPRLREMEMTHTAGARWYDQTDGRLSAKD